MSSKHLSAKQIGGVQKIGNVMFPGGEGFPSFIECGCARHLDRVLDYMPGQDLKDLGTLLSLLALMPGFFAGFFVWFLEIAAHIPGPLGGQLRLARIGVRGLIMSLYYGDPAIHKIIGYEVSVFSG